MESLAIISLAIQITEILENEIEKARSANRRVQHIAVDLRATAYLLTTLQTLLDEDLKISSDRLFTDKDRLNIDPVVQQCGKIFRQIANSFSRMGRVVELDAVDEHQPMTQSGSTAIVPYKTPSFKFSVRGRLMWHFRSREIRQYVADLDQLMAKIMHITAVAEAARQNRRRYKVTGRAAWKKWSGVGSLRQPWKILSLGHHQPTTLAIEAKQQLCIEAGPAKPVAAFWRQENRSPQR